MDNKCKKSPLDFIIVGSGQGKTSERPFISREEGAKARAQGKRQRLYDEVAELTPEIWEELQRRVNKEHFKLEQKP